MATLLLIIRPLVLILSLLLSLSIYAYSIFVIPVSSAQIAYLVRTYALVALFYLYSALLISPLYTVFPLLPLYGLFLKARRAIGVSAFFFALVHASLAFFKQLGGLEGLAFLPTNYLIAVGLGAVSLLILSTMALTSNDKMIALLTFRRWKFIHRFVYVAAVFILIHALLIGSDFRRPGILSLLRYTLITFLIILEAIRLKRFIGNKMFRPKSSDQNSIDTKSQSKQ